MVMLSDQIADTMNEVRDIIDQLGEGSVTWEMMSAAHSSLAQAHSLVSLVNRLHFENLYEEIKADRERGSKLRPFLPKDH